MSKNLFLENKDQRKPMVCVRRHKPTYASHTPVYTSANLRT